MSFDHPQKRFKALPVQFIEAGSGVILKRGCVEVKVGGKCAAEVVRAVINAASGEGATRQEICEPFALPDRPIVEQLIDQLIDRRLLVACDEACQASGSHESSSDIFYWHFGDSAAQVLGRLNSRNFVILGVNGVSRQLASALVASGVQTFRVVDHPLLRNLRFFDEAGKLKPLAWTVPSKTPEMWSGELPSKSLDCLVATSDFCARLTFQEINKFSVENKIHFLPVFLQNLIGYIGPFVIPGETACFECLIARQDANLEATNDHRQVEDFAFEGQDVIGFHPSMASVLGEISAFELIKFYGELIPYRKCGTLIEVNLLATRLTARKVLKIPRCSVCSPLITRPSMTPKMTVFSPVKRTQT